MTGTRHAPPLRIALAIAALLCLALAALAPSADAKRKPKTRDILMVGNNWDGTADVVDAHTWKKLKHLNIVPDREQRIAEINSDPVRAGYFAAIRQLIGEGHDQLVDDAFTNPEGTLVYVSRPSFADVVAISLRTGKIVW